MSNKARLRWRCRRGMRELDALMLGWLDTHYDSADHSSRARFEELLEMQDPDIISLLKQCEAAGSIPPQSHLDNHQKSSKDSSFETIIRQARDAARDAARNAATEAIRAKN